MLEANLAHFARTGGVLDSDKKYSRFELYNPVVQCPPGRGLSKYGGWMDPTVGVAGCCAGAGGACS